MSEAINGMISDDGGMHIVPTLGGCKLEARMDGQMITLTDENGTVATVTIADVKQYNGVIHVIDAVLLPPSPKEAGTGARAIFRRPPRPKAPTRSSAHPIVNPT